MWNILPVLILSVFCLIVSSAPGEKIKVSVYYESLCPDSAKFLTTQFYPTYLIDADQIDVDLVPYGRATSTNNAGTWSFTCEHGDGECYGNKVQACAINSYPVKESTEFVVCAMRSGDASSDENLQKCATSNNVSWLSIQECIRSGKADELLVANGLRTAAVEPPISFMPTIIFNNVYSKFLQDLSLTNFQEIFEFVTEKKAGIILGDGDGASGANRMPVTGALVAIMVILRQILG